MIRKIHIALIVGGIFWVNSAFSFDNSWNIGLHSSTFFNQSATRTEFKFSTTPANNSTERGASNFGRAGVSLNLSYRFKKRRTSKKFWESNLFISSFDNNEDIYGFNLNLGRTYQYAEPYFVVGNARFTSLRKNKFFTGAGVTIPISQRWSANTHWHHYETIFEESSSKNTFGAQILTIDTTTQRNIDLFNVGVRYTF